MESVIFTVLYITLYDQPLEGAVGRVDISVEAFTTLGRATQFFSSLHEMTLANHVVIWINLESRITARVVSIIDDGCIISVTSRDSLITRRLALRSFALVLGDSRL